MVTWSFELFEVTARVSLDLQGFLRSFGHLVTLLLKILKNRYITMT